MKRQKRFYAIAATPFIAGAAIVSVISMATSASAEDDRPVLNSDQITRSPISAPGTANREGFCAATGAFLNDDYFKSVDSDGDGLVSGNELDRKSSEAATLYGGGGADAYYIAYQDAKAWPYIETRKYEYGPDDHASRVDFQAAFSAQCS